MRIGSGGIISGRHDVADRGKDIVDRGKAFAGHVADAAKDAGEGAINKALPVVATAGDRVVPDGAPHVALGGFEKAVDAGAFAVNHTPGVPGNVKQAALRLGQVNFQGSVDTSGTKADWGRLFGDWFFERKPESLGTWGQVTVDGQQHYGVRVTDMSYARDLAGTTNQKGITNFFLGQKPQEGQDMKFRWLYTGSGTTEAGTKWNFVTDKGGAPVKEHGAYLTQGGLTQNRYGIIESFLGTHETKVKCTKVDPATGNVTLRYTVTNESHFQSGTRMPKILQDLGVPKYLIHDQSRGTDVHVGGNYHQVFTWEQTFNAQGKPVGDVGPVTD